MKQVLYITQKPHNPIVDGGTTAIASFFSLLQSCKNISLTYMPICTQKHAGDFTNMAKGNIEIRPMRIAFRPTLRALFRYPLNVARYQEANAILLSDKHDFDLVICDGFYALAIIPKSWFTSKTIFYRAHNIESEHWKQRTQFAIGFKKILYRLISKQIATFESKTLAKANTILSISHYETDFLKKWNSNTQTFYPILPAPNMTEMAAEPKLSIGFIGSFDWFPNQDAMDWFIAEIWPTVLRVMPNAHLNIAGKGSEHFHDDEKHIRGLGFVESLNDFYQNQACIISPLRYGTGMNIKVLEAMTFGKPIIATPLSLRAFSDQSKFTIAHDAEAFSKEIGRAHV